MKALTRLEGFIQDLVERPAWLLTARRLHPLEMAAALTRAMESDALPLADRVLAPDEYALRLSPEDYRQFSSVRRTLEREYAEYLNRLAIERDLTMAAPAAVAIVESRDVRPGAVTVLTRFGEEREPPARGVPVRERTAGAAAPQLVRAPQPPQHSTTGLIEVLNGDGSVTRRQSLDQETIVVGRRSSTGLPLADPEVSREHARIEYNGGRYYLHDLGSLNGTAVNGERITAPHPLADGDTITLGHSQLRFRRGG